MFTVEPAVSLPLKKRYMRGRRLVVLDIENAVGHADLTCEEVIWVRERLAALIGLTDSDQVVVGSSHLGLAAVGFARPQTRRVVRSGENGADLALLEVLDEDLPSRYDAVVLVSGDGDSSPTRSLHLGGAGVRVFQVVGHVDGLAKRLRLAASQVIYFGGRIQPQTLGGTA